MRMELDYILVVYKRRASIQHYPNVSKNGDRLPLTDYVAGAIRRWSMERLCVGDDVGEVDLRYPFEVAMPTWPGSSDFVEVRALEVVPFA